MRLMTKWIRDNERMPRAEVERILELTNLLRAQAATGARLHGFASPSTAEVSFRATYFSRRHVSS